MLYNNTDGTVEWPTVPTGPTGLHREFNTRCFSRSILK